jgi:hypothetical protein
MIFGWIVCCLVVSAVVLRLADDWISRQMHAEERDSMYVNAEARLKLAQTRPDHGVCIGCRIEGLYDLASSRCLCYWCAELERQRA